MTKAFPKVGNNKGEKVFFYAAKQVAFIWLPKPLRKLLGWVTLTLFCCIFYFVPFACFVASLLLFYDHYTAVACLGALMVVLTRYPGNTEWPAIRSVFTLWYEIFDLKTNISPDKMIYLGERGNKEKFIFAMHPHGIVPIQACLWAGFCDQFFPQLFGFGAAATVACKLPLLRAVLGWMTCVPADYDTLLRGLKEGHCSPANNNGREPKNLFVLAGGVAEVFTSTPGKDIIVYKNRRGLCRLSLETGATIMPAYVFGGNAFFHNFATGDGFLSRISRKVRAGLTLFSGQGGLPIPFTPKVRLAIGEPLELSKGAKVTDAAVDALHSRYIAEIQRVFDTHKEAAGYPNAILEIR